MIKIAVFSEKLSDGEKYLTFEKKGECNSCGAHKYNVIHVNIPVKKEGLSEEEIKKLKKFFVES